MDRWTMKALIHERHPGRPPYMEPKGECNDYKVAEGSIVFYIDPEDGSRSEVTGVTFDASSGGYVISLIYEDFWTGCQHDVFELFTQVEGF